MEEDLRSLISRQMSVHQTPGQLYKTVIYGPIFWGIAIMTMHQR